MTELISLACVGNENASRKGSDRVLEDSLRQFCGPPSLGPKSVVLGRGLRICMPNRCPGAAACLRPPC